MPWGGGMGMGGFGIEGAITRGVILPLTAVCHSFRHKIDRNLQLTEMCEVLSNDAMVLSGRKRGRN